MNMLTTKNMNQRQSGAALVIALILLVALSLMAISSMNTASLDLIMAGNEQYRSRAFAAAETGVQNAILSGTFNTGSSSSSSASTGIGDDSYNYTISTPNNGVVETSPPGYSAASGQFGAIYFRVVSTGSSYRGTRSSVTQELFQVVKSSDGPAYNPACGSGSLDGTISTC